MSALTNRDNRAPGYRNTLEPSACGQCGIRKDDHYQRWSHVVGWHLWVMPTQGQIKARMLKRRRDPLRWSFSR